MCATIHKICMLLGRAFFSFFCPPLAFLRKLLSCSISPVLLVPYLEVGGGGGGGGSQKIPSLETNKVKIKLGPPPDTGMPPNMPLLCTRFLVAVICSCVWHVFRKMTSQTESRLCHICHIAFICSKFSVSYFLQP